MATPSDTKAPVDDNTVAKIFENMNYGPVIEDDSLVQEWLNGHNRTFGFFTGGNKPSTHKSVSVQNQSTGEEIATVLQAQDEDVAHVVKSAVDGFQKWHALTSHQRARYLYSIARHIQKNQQLFTVLESMISGKTIRESRDFDIPHVVRCFYHYTGWAELMDDEFNNYQSVGVVLAIIPWNFPIMYLAWTVAPALAAGNSVIIKPSNATALSAILFADICSKVGLPPGTVNVITGNDNIERLLTVHLDVSMISFIGSLEHGKKLRSLTAGMGKKISLSLDGNCSMIVFESADHDSVVDGIVENAFFREGQASTSVSKLLVQESIFWSVIGKLKLRIAQLRIGPSLDKAVDVGAMFDLDHRIHLERAMDEAKEDGAQIFHVPGCTPKSGYYYPPTLVTHVQPGAAIVMEQVHGPVVVAMPFRTAKEAIGLANTSKYGLAASVWTEHSALALEVARGLRVGTVWINSHNTFDAAALFNGCKQSGVAQFGGKEGLHQYLRPCLPEPASIIPTDAFIDVDLASFGTIPSAAGASPTVEGKILPMEELIDKTYKLYIGGQQKRPAGNCSREIVGADGRIIGQVSESSRKDMRNAVEAALKAQPSWEKKSGHNRAQILYFIAENMVERRDQLARQINWSNATEWTIDTALQEVDQAIKQLFYWAARCDKYGGEIQETTMYGLTAKIHEAVGVIGIVCPDDDYPLLSFVSLFAPAIARGNSVIIVPSQKSPLPALDLYQVFETSDVPGGVINILSGDSIYLARQLAEHHEVSAVWYFGSRNGCTMVEYVSANSMKRTWVSNGCSRNWFDPFQGQEEFLHHSVHCKTIWMPMGEIFAN